MPDKKLTDAEIVKALNTVLYVRKFVLAKSGNVIVTVGDFLDLINRLQAENRELQEMIVNCNSGNIKLEAEIERLKNSISDFIVPARGGGKTPLVRMRVDKIKAEAIKEFAERLKRELPKWLHPYIDRTKKEMAGEE